MADNFFTVLSSHGFWIYDKEHIILFLDLGVWLDDDNVCVCVCVCVSMLLTCVYVCVYVANICVCVCMLVKCVYVEVHTDA